MIQKIKIFIERNNIFVFLKIFEIKIKNVTKTIEKNLKSEFPVNFQQINLFNTLQKT
jgi:hypothetical protein